ncbi:hypothetical protein ABE288_20445 [Bacillus salipaludis]|uniref:hypothetical protein n=1 Tax=Bacillus salipaludis TaxID=2547811 RepID=UPI003D24D2A4
MLEVNSIVNSSIEQFCKDFIDNPYLCYTEHGIHAYFYNILFQNLAPEQRYIDIGSHKVCVLQKEYPTNHNLDKSKRQNWDIAVINAKQLNFPSYDHLELDSVIEFGLNEPLEHLQDDLNRILHSKANVTNKFLVHLHRLSGFGNDRISRRDWSQKSKRIVMLEEIINICKDTDSVIYYAMFDSSELFQNGVWKIAENRVEKLK